VDRSLVAAVVGYVWGCLCDVAGGVSPFLISD